MNKPRDDDEPRTLHELQKRRSANPEVFVGEGSDPVPKLPPESPWTTQLPDEPLIDRTEDKS
jgi:hypothetical protein